MWPLFTVTGSTEAATRALWTRGRSAASPRSRSISAVTADREAGSYSVNLIVGEEDGEPVIESREVTIGLRDNSFTEITSGLAEGDDVQIGELSAPTIDFNAGFGNGGDD